MEDEGYRLNRAFEGRDCQCTHIVIYDGGEPIGASRIRWFKDFAKVERTAFRKAYRNVGVLRDTSRFIFRHAAKHGYGRLVTVAEERYSLMWMRVPGFTMLFKTTVSLPGLTGRFYLLDARIVLPDETTRPNTPNIVMIRNARSSDRIL